MRTELLKVRSMPTPKWCLFAVAVFFLIGLVATYAWGLGEEQLAIDLGVGVPTSIIAIVFGVWIFGFEYGQNTLRRTLTADPRRLRLILSKLAVLLIAVTVVTALAYLLAFALYGVVADFSHDQSLSAETVMRNGAASLVSNLAYAVVGMAFAMISTSMAGGMTIALVFIFVIDGIISLLPRVGDYTLGVATVDISNSIRGSTGEIFGDSMVHSPELATLILVAWLVVLVGLGSLRLVRSDIS